MSGSLDSALVSGLNRHSWSLGNYRNVSACAPQGNRKCLSLKYQELKSIFPAISKPNNQPTRVKAVCCRFVMLRNFINIL